MRGDNHEISRAVRDSFNEGLELGRLQGRAVKPRAVDEVRVMDPRTNQVYVMSGADAAAYFESLHDEGRRTVAAHVVALVLLVAALAASVYALSRLAQSQREACGRAEVTAGLGGEPVPAGCREVRR